MALLDPLTGALRSAVGLASTEAKLAEHELGDLIHALHRVADSTERQVRLLEGLAETIGPMDEKVALLNVQIDELMAVLAPLQAVEKDVSRIEHLFGRHRDK